MNRKYECRPDCPERSAICHTAEFNCPHYRKDCARREQERAERQKEGVLVDYIRTAKKRSMKRAHDWSAEKSNLNYK